jgi:hypothetical protein
MKVYLLSLGQSQHRSGVLSTGSLVVFANARPLVFDTGAYVRLTDV